MQVLPAADGSLCLSFKPVDTGGMLKLGCWQVAALAFYVVTAVQFRPQAEGAYMVLTESYDDDFRKADQA